MAFRLKAERREKGGNPKVSTSWVGPGERWVEMTTGDREDSGPAGGALQQKRMYGRRKPCLAIWGLLSEV